MRYMQPGAATKNQEAYSPGRTCMKNPVRSIDRQRMLWESSSDESPAVLSDEQQKELMNALMELLLSSGRVFQISAPISPGSSGSPVVNLRGEVVGVATFQYAESQSLNFAVPADRLPRREFVFPESFWTGQTIACLMGPTRISRKVMGWRRVRVAMRQCRIIR